MAKRMDDRFVADGHQRARAANEATIRSEVEREYAEQLQSAGWFSRWQLLWRIEREIEERLESIAPASGLYLHQA